MTTSVAIAKVRERDTMSLGNRCGLYSGRDVYRTSDLSCKGSIPLKQIAPTSLFNNMINAQQQLILLIAVRSPLTFLSQCNFSGSTSSLVYDRTNRQNMTVSKNTKQHIYTMFTTSHATFFFF